MADQPHPIIDPTANVIAKAEADIKRLDDLRELQARLTEERLNRIEQIGELRAKHEAELRKSEADRLNAIRQEDKAAVQTLASTTVATAEILRTMVADTAKNIASQTQTAMTGINDRISILERASYEEKGKSGVSDPALEKLMSRMDSLIESRAEGTGKSAGLGLGWAILIGVVGFIGMVLGIVGGIAAFVK